MDFASLMSKEISKAKGTSASPDPSNGNPKPEKKYVRRGELEAARIAAYNEEQERLRREREARNAQKRKLEEEEAAQRREREEKKRRLAEESQKRREEKEAEQERERRKRLGLPELPEPAKQDDEAKVSENGGEEDDIPDEGLIAKLRELDEPARLFGETHHARLRRYRRLTSKSLGGKSKLSDGPIPTTLELVPEVEMKIPSTVPKDKEGRIFLMRQLASYFNMVLSEWEIALSKRDLAVKQSLQGRQAYNAMVQSRENLKPLYRKFEKGDVDKGVLEPVVEIVHKAQLRRYVDANDAYLRLSIGKA